MFQVKMPTFYRRSVTSKGNLFFAWYFEKFPCSEVGSSMGAGGGSPHHLVLFGFQSQLPTLHYTALHYNTLHNTALHFTTLHYTKHHYATKALDIFLLAIPKSCPIAICQKPVLNYPRVWRNENGLGSGYLVRGAFK